MAKRKPPSSSSRPSRDRVAAHTDRQRERGLVRVHVWVPEGDAERVRDIAAGLRAKAGLALPGDGKPTPRALQLPEVTPRHPRAPRVWIEIGPSEELLQALVKTNDGEWHGQRKLWSVPERVVDELGLRDRVRSVRP